MSHWLIIDLRVRLIVDRVEPLQRASGLPPSSTTRRRTWECPVRTARPNLTPSNAQSSLAVTAQNGCGGGVCVCGGGLQLAGTAGVDHSGLEHGGWGWGTAEWRAGLGKASCSFLRVRRANRRDRRWRRHRRWRRRRRKPASRTAGCSRCTLAASWSPQDAPG